MSEACLQSQDEAFKEVTERLANLKNSVTDEVQKAIHHIEQVFDKAILEIVAGDGLTMKTCQRMSELMIATETAAQENIESGVEVHKSINALLGLRLIHQTMSLISKHQGINEGDKPCCPFCVDPC